VATAIDFPILEIFPKVDDGLSQANLGMLAAKLTAGSRAFRDYGWLNQVRPVNISGNYRGMVVNAKWATAFRFINKYGEDLDNLSNFVGFVANLAEAVPSIEAVYGSHDPSSTKALRYAAIAGTAAQRTLMGVVPTGVHLIYRSLEGWCMIAGLLGGPFRSGSTQALDVIKSADVLVQSTFLTVTNTQNQGNAIWSVIDTVLSSRIRPAAETGIWRPLQRY